MRQPSTVVEVYDALTTDGFSANRLEALDESGYLELQVWPNFDAAQDRKWTLLTIWLLQTKKTLGKPTLSAILTGSEKDAQFDPFFTGVLQTILDSNLPFPTRSAAVSVLNDVFLNLDIPQAQKSCQSLVSILCWQHLTKSYRQSLFDRSPVLKGRYKSRLKDMGRAEEPRRTTMQFRSTFWYNLMLEVVSLMNIRRNDEETLLFCTSVLEVMTDALCQLPTRRYLIYLIKDLQLISCLKLSHRFSSTKDQVSAHLTAQLRLLREFISWPYDDIGGRQFSILESRAQHAKLITDFQHVAYKHFKDDLVLLALSHHATISSKDELLSHLREVDQQELLALATCLDIRSTSIAEDNNQKYLIEAIVERFESRVSSTENVSRSPIFPTEAVLFGAQGIPSDYRHRSPPMAKLTIQFLSIEDILGRNFVAYRNMMFDFMRDEIIAIYSRLLPQISYPSGEITFSGSSKKAVHISAPTILEVTPPSTTSDGRPGLVRGEVRIDLESASARSVWTSVQPGDLLYFLHLGPLTELGTTAPNHSTMETTSRAALKYVRTATLEAVLDEERRPLKLHTNGMNNASRGNIRYYRVLFDPKAFQDDRNSVRLEDVYDKFNVLLTGISTSDQTLPLLQAIQELVTHSCPCIPAYLQETYLGYGDNSQKETLPGVHHSEETSDLKHASRISKKLNFTSSQAAAIRAGTQPGLSLIDAVAGSGKSCILAQIVSDLYHADISQRTVLLCRNELECNHFRNRLTQLGIGIHHILDLTNAADSVQQAMQKRTLLLQEVTRLARFLSLDGDHGASCETAAYFYLTMIKSAVEAEEEAADRLSYTPEHTRIRLKSFYTDMPSKMTYDADPRHGKCFKSYIKDIFDTLAELRPLEILKSDVLRERHLLTQGAKVILLTGRDVIHRHEEARRIGISFDNVLVDQAASIPEIEVLLAMSWAENPNTIRRLVLVGDTMQIGPSSSPEHRVKQLAQSSSLARLGRSGVHKWTVNEQFRSRASISSVVKHVYNKFEDILPQDEKMFKLANAGLVHTCQFINVPNYKKQGEFSPRRDIWQNLGEAEFVVALYQYLRLLNYPKEKIVLLTPYVGQKALLLDVLNARCTRNPIFGLPTVATVEEYQGQESDYVLVSLVRTTRTPAFNDRGLLTSAFSRARLGLYVFGRRDIMPRMAEPFIEELDKTQDCKLELVYGEMFPSERLEDAPSERTTVMEGVDHLGQYVYEMTRKKMESMG